MRLFTLITTNHDWFCNESRSTATLVFCRTIFGSLIKKVVTDTREMSCLDKAPCEKDKKEIVLWLLGSKPKIVSNRRYQQCMDVLIFFTC